MSKYYSTLKGEGSWEKWEIPGKDQEKYKMNLEYFIMSENSKCLKNDGIMSKRYKSLEGPFIG